MVRPLWWTERQRATIVKSSIRWIYVISFSVILTPCSGRQLTLTCALVPGTWEQVKGKSSTRRWDPLGLCDMIICERWTSESLKSIERKERKTPAATRHPLKRITGQRSQIKAWAPSCTAEQVEVQHYHKYWSAQVQKYQDVVLVLSPCRRRFNTIRCQLLDKITAEVYFRQLTFSQLSCLLFSPWLQALSFISLFSTVSCSDRDSTAQEKKRKPGLRSIRGICGFKIVSSRAAPASDTWTCYSPPSHADILCVLILNNVSR